MGEEISGSSSAAQRAQQPDPQQDSRADTDHAPAEFVRHKDAQPGLFRRLVSAVRQPSEDEDGEMQGPNRSPHVIGLANLQAKRVRDVAIPRAEINSVSQELGLEELVGIFRESGYTRLPVFQDTLDTPTGMIHLKDVALRYGFNGKSSNFSLEDMVRPVLFVPPSMPIGVLLQKMQTERKHMALVIDEYGGVDGLVTIEDLIEQVLGAIDDEHDVEEALMWKQEKPGRYLAQARTPLRDFEAETGVQLFAEDMGEDIDSLGGLVFMLAGRVPARGEVVKLEGTAEFEIVDADPRRIKRVRVILPPTQG